MASEPDMMNQSLKLVDGLIDLDPPSEIGLYLGCIHQVGTVIVQNREVRSMTYDMDGLLSSCWDVYIDVVP